MSILGVYNWDGNEDNVPAEFELVDEIEWSDGNYQFDTTGVFKELATGKLFYGTDSGCSCPSPWESHERVDLTEITRPQDFYDHTASRLPSNGGDDDKYGLADKGALIDDIYRAEQIVRAHFRDG